MLVTKRTINDTFKIEPNITIKILDINTENNSVSVGIDAPKNIFITVCEERQDANFEVIHAKDTTSTTNQKFA